MTKRLYISTFSLKIKKNTKKINHHFREISNYIKNFNNYIFYIKNTLVFLHFIQTKQQLQRELLLRVCLSDNLSSTLISLCTQRKNVNQRIENAWFSGSQVESNIKILPKDLLENQVEKLSTMGKKLSSCKNPKFVEIIEKIEKCCSKYEMFCDLADNDLTLENNLKAIGEINQKDSLRKISPVTKCCIPYQLPCGHKMGTKYFLRVAQELKDKAKEGPIQFRCPFECKHVLSERDLFALLGSQFKSITSNYEKYSDICMFCGAKPREKLILIHYHHFLCSSCLYSLIKISTEGQMIIIDRTLVSSSKIFSSDNTPIKCPARNCSYHMDISIIKYIMSERDFSIAYRKALSQVGSSGSMSAVPRYIITCIICSATVDEAEGYEMECHHGYCNKCMGKYLEEQFAKGKGMHGMQCKYNGCKQAFNLYILKQFLGTDRVHKLKERTDKQKSQVFEYQ